MKGSIKEYLTFTKAERIGIILLFSAIVLILAIPHFIPSTDHHTPTDQLYKVEVQKFIEGIEGSHDRIGTAHSDYSIDYTSRFKPHSFDPNTITADEYVEMGFSAKQAASMIKYREKGGTFEFKEDFNKLYVVDDETFNLFKSYIRLPDQPLQSSRQSYESSGQAYQSSGQSNENSGKSFLSDETHQSQVNYAGKKQFVIVELNSADSLELLKVKGIGPVFASRILKFRNRIGGFARVEQLMDVYGIDSTRYPDLRPQVKVDTSLVKKLKINAVSLQDLKKHPYFNYYLAKAVIDRRIQKGILNRPSDIRDLFKNKQDVFEKLIPYLDFSR